MFADLLVPICPFEESFYNNNVFLKVFIIFLYYVKWNVWLTILCGRG